MSGEFALFAPLFSRLLGTIWSEVTHRAEREQLAYGQADFARELKAKNQGYA